MAYYPMRSNVDFYGLPLPTLLRYAARYRIPTRADATKNELATAVHAHFELQLDVEEDHVLSRFVNAVRRSGIRDHPRNIRTSQAPIIQPPPPHVMRDVIPQQNARTQILAQDSNYSMPDMSYGSNLGGYQYDGGHNGIGFSDDQDSYSSRKNGQKRKRPKSTSNRPEYGQPQMSGISYGEQEYDMPQGSSQQMMPSAQSEDEPYIACDHSECPVEWYRLSSVGLTPETVPKGQWFCPQCRENPSDHSIPASTPREAPGGSRKNGRSATRGKRKR